MSPCAREILPPVRRGRHGGFWAGLKKKGEAGPRVLGSVMVAQKTLVT